jgi:hypothetical protein
LKITISERELKFLKVLATGRHFLKDQVNPDRPSVARWGNTQAQADLMGVLGEYAVAKALKLPFDTSINLEGDGGSTDLMLGEYDIQVKSTKYKTGRLVFNNRKEIGADVFILCLVNEEAMEVTILGYIRKQSIEDCLVEMNLGHGKRLVVEQKFLKPISLLTAYLEKLS